MTITHHKPTKKDDHRFTLLYDGECPLCRREVNWFCRRAPEAINAVDISLSDFDSTAFGLNEDAVHRELHGIKPDGGVTVGIVGSDTSLTIERQRPLSPWRCSRLSSSTVAYSEKPRGTMIWQE